MLSLKEQKELEMLRAQDQREIKALKKELQRKEKAMAKMAAWLPDTTGRPVATERVSADWVGR